MTVDGYFEVKNLTSIITGVPAVVVEVEPDTIKYGFFTNKLETGWKSVRVLNRLDLVYVDDDVRIMKGGSADSYFFFQRRRAL